MLSRTVPLMLAATTSAECEARQAAEPAARRSGETGFVGIESKGECAEQRGSDGENPGTGSDIDNDVLRADHRLQGGEDKLSAGVLASTGGEAGIVNEA